MHRDLKPGTIMLTPTGAKLRDFGLAKPAVPLTTGATLTAAATQTTPVTQEGTILGTVQYMSPEHIEGAQGGWAIWMLPLDGERKPFLFHKSQFAERQARQPSAAITLGVNWPAELEKK